MRVLTKALIVISTLMVVATLALSFHIYYSPVEEETVFDETQFGSLNDYYSEEGNEGSTDILPGVGGEVLFFGSWESDDFVEYNFLPNGEYNYTTSFDYDEDSIDPLSPTILGASPKGRFEINETAQNIVLKDNVTAQFQSFEYDFGEKNNSLYLRNTFTNETVKLDRQINTVDNPVDVENFANQRANVVGYFNASPDLKSGNITLAGSSYGDPANFQVAIPLENYSWDYNLSEFQGKKVQVQANIIKTPDDSNFTWYPYPYYLTFIELIEVLDE